MAVGTSAPSAPSAAAAGASGAPGSQQNSSGKAPAGVVGGAAQGAGGDFDYKSAFTSQSRKIQETEGRLGDLSKEVEGSRSDREMLKKLRDVFNPQDSGKKQAADPVPGWEQQLDFYISQAVEADKAGRGIPLTANLAISHYKSLIENHQVQSQYQQKIDTLESMVNQLRDPGHNINQRAFSSFDTSIQNGLERIYGSDPGSFPQRQALFKAVGDLVGPAVNSLMKNDPKRWDMIRRDPAELEKIANRALRAVLPPKAVQMIEQEQLRNTPMSLTELQTAFREANGIKDESERQRVRTKIRQDILAMSMGGDRGGMRVAR